MHNVLLWVVVTFLWEAIGGTYTAGIWDEIITALVLIEAFIPGVIWAKQTTLESSKSQLGLRGELCAEMQCAASS